MILKIGIKKNNFTLIEVMLATVFLVFGSILIYGAFFSLINAFGYYSNYLNALTTFEEKIFYIQNALSKNLMLDDLELVGDFTRNGRIFFWQITYELEDELKDYFKLYKITANLNWQESGKRFTLERISYALYKK